MNEEDLRIRLAKLENRVAYLFQELGLEEKYQADWARQTTQTGMADVIALLRMNQKINAIKLYREKTGTGLREAKDAVENMEDFI
jgi:large subunit ribosomal protein L7/L12